MGEGRTGERDRREGEEMRGREKERGEGEGRRERERKREELEREGGKRGRWRKWRGR